MESKTLALSMRQNDEYGYELAHRLAREQLLKIDDVAPQCSKSGAQYLESRKAITIEYLNQSYRITLPEVKISLTGEGETVPIRDQILILHYLTQAKGTPLSKQMITYKELPGGSVYFPTFCQRTIRPLVNCFGNAPHRLLEIAKIFGGHQADYGDVAVTINAFRRVPITLVLWQGDGEFAPEGNIMFDRTISDYLPTEDITVLCETIVRGLIKLLKAGGPGSRCR
ncbi:DUF3786 domain-containing protein [Chloroflexota bacterium]